LKERPQDTVNIVHVDLKNKRLLVSHRPGFDCYHIPVRDDKTLEMLNELLHPDQIKIKD